MPIIVFFGALALPLRKDQPMEIYMAALVSFYLKPHRRLWEPDGLESLIEITAPKTTDKPVLKNLSQSEAERRFGYLAEITDSQGWAIRGVGAQAPNTTLNSDVYFAAQQVQDVLDEENKTIQNFDQKLNESDARRHQEMIDLANGKQMEPQTKFNYFVAPTEEIIPTTIQENQIRYNPYPNDIHQSVIQPISTDLAVENKETNTSEKPVPTAIIELATNSTGRTIESIAREANHIHEQLDSDEVVISLR